MDGNRFSESVYNGFGRRVIGCIGNEGRTSSVHGCPVVLGVTGQALVPINECRE